MFRRWMTALVIKNFARRFRILEKVTRTGRVSDIQAATLWGKAVYDCNQYLLDTPDEFLPAYARLPLFIEDKELIHQIMSEGK